MDELNIFPKSFSFSEKKIRRKIDEPPKVAQKFENALEIVILLAAVR